MLEGGAGFYDEGSTRVPSGLCQRSGFRAQNFELGGVRGVGRQLAKLFTYGASLTSTNHVV